MRARIAIALPLAHASFDCDGAGACEVDADCPTGLRRCRDTSDGRVCVRAERSPPERCEALVESGGHDFSVAWLLERGGDDVYRAPGISFGGGNEAGAGLFADLAGVDTYDASNARSYGWAGIDRPGEDVGRMQSGTVGIFLEADGVDTYARPDLGDVGNDATWRRERNAPQQGERGVGLHRTGGRTGLEAR
jgi:hypothetical protein